MTKTRLQLLSQPEWKAVRALGVLGLFESSLAYTETWQECMFGNLRLDQLTFCGGRAVSAQNIARKGVG
jgi:hypothetical protein